MARLLPRLALLSVLVLSALAALGLPGARADDPATPAATPARKPYLWVVEGPPRIYLFGTIHIPDDRVKDLPEVVTAAHAASNVVWGELSGEDMDSPDILAAMALPGAKTLADVVPKETLEHVHEYVEARGFPAALVDRYKPMWAAVFLSMLDVLPLLSTRVAMDKQLLLDAKEAWKETGGLETVAEHMAIFEKVPPGTAAKFLDQTVKDLERARDEGTNPADAMLDAYCSGDLEKLNAVLERMTTAEDPEVRAFAKRLLKDRNVLMVDRLLERTKAAPGKTYFVAVGAAHYPGPDGILALLEKKGVKTRRLGFDAKIPAATPVAAAK